MFGMIVSQFYGFATEFYIHQNKNSIPSVIRQFLWFDDTNFEPHVYEKEMASFIPLHEYIYILPDSGAIYRYDPVLQGLVHIAKDVLGQRPTPVQSPNASLVTKKANLTTKNKVAKTAQSNLPKPDEKKEEKSSQEQEPKPWNLISKTDARNIVKELPDKVKAHILKKSRRYTNRHRLDQGMHKDSLIIKMKEKYVKKISES